MNPQSSSVLIIIPCLNEENYIGALVEKLVADTKDLSARIIIADGASTDQTPEIAKALAQKYENVEYLHNQKRLQSAAINLAVETCARDEAYLIRIDAHADYPADFCSKLLEEAEKMQAASIVVSMQTEGNTPFQKAVAAAQNSKLGNGGSAHRSAGGQGSWVDHGHHALMRIDAFKAVQGYDESFSHNEDAELDYRLHKEGHKIWLTGQTDMIYYPRSAPWPLFKQYYKFGQGRIRNILKHKMCPRLRQMIPVGIAPVIIMGLVLGSLHGVFWLPALFWSCVCLSYGALLALRAKDPVLGLSGPAAMIMHLAWSLGFWSGLLKYAGEA